MRKSATLPEVLDYQNREIVARFAKETGIPRHDAEEVFVELKRWLWLCSYLRGVPVNMVGEAFVIDEMWHVFLLFTRDYSAFCDRYFGEFIHHTPKTSADQAAWQVALAGSSDQTLRNWRTSIKQDYELIYDHLGPVTLFKWCHEFPKKFQRLRPTKMKENE